MMYDIFSGFDDHNFVFFGFFYLVWCVVLFIAIGFLPSPWGRFSRCRTSIYSLVGVVGGLVVRRVGKEIGGSFAVFSSLFLSLVLFNVSGLIPYVFSLTRHLAVNLAISFPLWVSIVMIGVCYDFVGFLSHLQPIGSPVLLNPFLCLIELVSNLVRPLTLSVRLTANLRTGHILMALSGMSFVNGGVLVGLFVFIIGLFYFMFELGVCFVQGYIFTLLPTLYVDEHPGSG